MTRKSSSDALAKPVSRSSRHRALLSTVAGMATAAATVAAVLTGAPAAQAQGYDRGSSVEALWQRCVDARTDAQALPVCMEAAKLGHPRAMATVGKIYFEGEGVEHNPSLALYWCEKAAALGNRGAMFVLGRMYEEAVGVPQDLHRAAAYYEKSAELGFSKAQFALGISYEFGEGVARNRQNAVAWLSRAAAQGDGRAGWFAEWLQNPRTPHFANEDQLAAYIKGQVAAYYRPAPVDATACRTWAYQMCAADRKQFQWNHEYHPPGAVMPN